MTPAEFSPHSPGLDRDFKLFAGSDMRMPKEMDWNAIAEQNAGAVAIEGEPEGLTIDLGLNDESGKGL